MTSEGERLERVLAVVYPAADVVTVAVVLAVLARRAVDRLVGAAAARGGRCGVASRSPTARSRT